MTCDKCGRPVIKARLPSGHEQLFNAAPDQNNGQALILNGNAMFVDGNVLAEARRAGLPTYARHGVTCPHYWR